MKENNINDENNKNLNDIEFNKKSSKQIDNNRYNHQIKIESIASKPLGPEDFPVKKFKQLDTKRMFTLSCYNLDIEGSVPQKYGMYTRKTNYNLTNLDIEKSTTSPLYKFTNKIDFTNTNKDIEGSEPKGHHCFHSRRHVNPLCPVYDFPKFNEKIILDNNNGKFLRDNLDISDISGAQCPNRMNSNIKVRDNLDKYKRDRDDELFISHQNLYKRNKSYNYLNYIDVYKKGKISKRHINPLNPIYKYGYADGTKVEIGDIEGSHPVAFSRFKLEKVNKGNSTKDIFGAQPDTKTDLAKFRLKHNHSINYILDDIPGAHQGTLLKGIKTKRFLNPLVPNYTPLGKEDKPMDFNDRNNFNKKFDYSSLYEFYKKHNTNFLADLKEREAQNKKDKQLNNENIKKVDIANYKKLTKDPVKLSAEKEDYKNKEFEKIKKEGIEYIKNLEARKDDDPKSLKQFDYDKNNFPDPSLIPNKKLSNDFDKNLYKKPDDFYGIKHDKLIISTESTKGKSKIDEIQNLGKTYLIKEKASQMKKKLNQITNKFSSYEDKLTCFIQKSSNPKYTII